VRVLLNVRLFALGAAAEILKLSLAANEQVRQLGFLLDQTVALARYGLERG